ncbi:gluconate 2-dehydrogenase subunit 3 family protein [Rhizobium rhizogenes]|jgi:gluconate 2-dehydrogenase gamma chain|uniref:gluconate 2-dehydrogenase subunit 3 family protein n=1 Tax=Rhizobium rhizogenes TaxID=359 RepID=UPI001F2B32FC|nr:gluconate 2-dehydrogenase subunit 3 family protein [Rhizobium rhizogenes]
MENDLGPMDITSTPRLTRRQILSTTAMALIFGVASKANALVINDQPPWKPFDASPPETLPAGQWYFFTEQEAATVGAIADRLIPADDLSVSGKDAGCVEFIDRQLAGFFGNFDRLYMAGPFVDGTPEQGDQSPFVPRQRYRIGLAALDAHCRSAFNSSFAELKGEQRDKVLKALESGSITLDGIDAKLFFSTVHLNTMEGFFADPIYGGNKDMVSWKMLGFPGARYDYRNYVDLHDEKLDLPPLSIAGRPEWKVKG